MSLPMEPLSGAKFHDITYDYSDVPTCQEFAASNAFMRGLQGPFGSGKSSACVTEITNRARRQRRGPDGIRHSRWGVIRNTYSELSLTTIRTVFQWLPPQYFGRYVENKHTYTVKAIPECDIEIQFIALDRPDDIKKLLSLELTGAWINEAREVPWSVIEAAQGRVGRWPAKRDGGPSWHGVWMDTNPPDSDSKWYRYFEEKTWLKDFQRMQRDGDIPASMRPEQFAAIFKQPSGMSPKAENLSNLPGGRRYYANLSAGKSAEWVKVYVDGEYGFVVEGKLVYPEYSDAIHCRSIDPIEGIEILRGWDFGLTPSCVFSQLLPDGRWLVFDEMTSDNMSVDQFGDEVIEHCNRAFKGRAQFRDVGDPAGDIRVETDKKTSFDILRAKDIDIRGAVTQDPTLRQESVRKPLRTLEGGEPQLILHPRCRMLRKGFMGGYHRRRMQTKGPERYSEKPEKNEYSHCFPAGVLVSTPRGPQAIEHLRIGDLVRTPIGPRRVLATMNRIAPVGVLSTASGIHLPCTPNHPIWTEGGFIRADAMRYGERLAKDPKWADLRNIPSKRSKVSAITGRLAAIIAAIRNTAANICIAPFGGITTATFLQAMTSTTSTRIEETMWIPIWNASAARSTPQCTVGCGRPPTQSARQLTWQLFGERPANGIDQKLVAPGIASMQRRLWLRLQSIIMSACSAEAPIHLSADNARSDIVPRLARALRAGAAELTTSLGIVWSAADRSWSIGSRRHALAADTLASANFGDVADRRVYDLTVEDAHCFYANGLLVSNCHDALQYAAAEHFAPALVTNPRNIDEDDWYAQRGHFSDDAGDRDEITGY